MNNVIVDSSGWIEYFTGGKNSKRFSGLIQDSENLIVPAITIYEVYKKFLRETDESEAIKVSAQMRKGKVLDLNEYLSIWAAKLSHDLKIPMADSVILASAFATNSTIYTMDSDFKNIQGVEYIP
jgi:predicted nucleic acid-binding protein